MAASLRELAFRLLYIRRLGAGIRRRLTPFRKVRGLDEKACGDLRICGGLCKVQKGGRLFGEKFFARHFLVPVITHTTHRPRQIRRSAESVPGKSIKVNARRQFRKS
jgi:hypothetical protein